MKHKIYKVPVENVDEKDLTKTMGDMVKDLNNGWKIERADSAGETIMYIMRYEKSE